MYTLHKTMKVVTITEQGLLCFEVVQRWKYKIAFCASYALYSNVSNSIEQIWNWQPGNAWLGRLDERNCTSNDMYELQRYYQEFVQRFL